MLSDKERLRVVELELKQLKAQLARQIRLLCYADIASSATQSHKDVLVEIENQYGLTHIASPVTNDIRRGIHLATIKEYTGDPWGSLLQIAGASL